VQLSEALIEKSSIGCYVYHGGRLLDVMVISELEQTLKLIFNDRSQIIQIVVKQLGQGEIKFGKHFFTNICSDLTAHLHFYRINFY
jgi:hypothetical protein